MQILYKLMMEFLQLGLFSYGGGLAILALIQDRVYELNWLTTREFADMVAISQSTPGPIAVNLATFVGFSQAGLLGSLVATFSVILPGSILSMFIGRFMERFDEKVIVKAILRGLRAVVIGLMVVAIIGIAEVSIVDIAAYEQTKKLTDLVEPISLALFVLIVILARKFKKHPFFYIVPAAIVGMVIWH